MTPKPDSTTRQPRIMTVEFERSMRAVTEPGQINLAGVMVARVWLGLNRGGKPHITLVGDDMADVLASLRAWDGAGRPSMAEAKAMARNTSSTTEADRG